MATPYSSIATQNIANFNKFLSSNAITLAKLGEEKYGQFLEQSKTALFAANANDEIFSPLEFCQKSKLTKNLKEFETPSIVTRTNGNNRSAAQLKQNQNTLG